VPAPPPASAAALELYEGLGPAFTQNDEAFGWAALKLCGALVTRNIDLIYEIVTDSDSGPGWQILLDPSRCPAICLPFLAQFVGARLTPAMTVEQQRDAISNPEGFGRGTPAAMVAVTKRRLTGTKTVLLLERYTGLAYRTKILTLESETPEPAETLADLKLQQKPIGIRLFFNTSPDSTWAEVLEEKTTWKKVEEGWATWGDLVAGV
jgi:hypothetical protein